MKTQSNTRYVQNTLYVENVSVSDIAKKFGTPCYVYSQAALMQNIKAFTDSFDPQTTAIVYAVKANSNLTLLNLIAQSNLGFDIVSGGELARVLAAKGDPQKIIFSGVGKSTREIEEALLANIGCFNVESSPELERLAHIAAKLGKKAPFAIRVNPNIPVETHPYITTGLKENKFGVEAEQALALYHHAKNLPTLNPVGIACHLGSQILEAKPYVLAFQHLLTLCETLKASGIFLKHIDIGGGFGVSYQNEAPLTPASLSKALGPALKQNPYRLVLAPGRAITAQAGLLLTQVEYLKESHGKHFAVVDAGMNDFLRPALYDAWQDIIPVSPDEKINKMEYDVVGPVCESADIFAKNRMLSLLPGSLLAICDAGAYGFSMSSNYNSRPHPPEVLIEGDRMIEIRPRGTYESLFQTEQNVPYLLYPQRTGFRVGGKPRATGVYKEVHEDCEEAQPTPPKT